MRVVRKRSRKRFFGRVMYEYERFLVPIPSKYRDDVKKWHGEDMKVSVETFDGGFAVLVCRENRWHMGRTLSSVFEDKIRQLREESAPRRDAR